MVNHRQNRDDAPANAFEQHEKRHRTAATTPSHDNNNNSDNNDTNGYSCKQAEKKIELIKLREQNKRTVKQACCWCCAANDDVVFLSQQEENRATKLFVTLFFFSCFVFVVAVLHKTQFNTRINHSKIVESTKRNANQMQMHLCIRFKAFHKHKHKCAVIPHHATQPQRRTVFSSLSLNSIVIAWAKMKIYPEWSWSRKKIHDKNNDNNNNYSTRANIHSRANVHCDSNFNLTEVKS